MNDLVRSVDSGGNTFPPYAGIKRSEIKSGLEPITVSLPASHEYPAAYAQQAPGTETTITIQQLDLDDDPDSLRVLYKGFVKGINLSEDNHTATLAIDPVSTGLDSEIPMDTFSPQCQTVLFSTDRCKVSKATYTFTGEVSAEDGNTITVTGLEAAKGDGWAVPGTVEYGDDVRQVFSQDGDVLTLAIPFAGSLVGEDVDVTAGCDGSITTCRDKFDNVANFRGCPYIPSENIFITGLQ